MTWFRNLIQDSEEITVDIDDSGHLSFLIEHLELELQRMGTTSDRKFNKRVNRILEGLNNNIDGNKFEQAHEDLGKFLGYNANNTEESGGPDPWWLARNDFCIAFEDYTETDGTKPIPTYKIRQLNDHPTWIREKESLSTDTEFIRVIITPANKVERTAVTIANNTFYWNQKDFVNWTNKALQTIRELRLDFTGPGNEEWRFKAISVYRDAKLDPPSLKSMLSSYLLSDLENV